MVRTLIIPKQQTISISVPPNYVGKQIEILLYAIDELIDDKRLINKKDASKYKGIFSKKKVKNLMNILNKQETNGIPMPD